MFAMLGNMQDQRQAELLDLYWQRLSAGLDAEVPDGLDEGLAALAARLAAEAVAPAQDAASTARVSQRLEAAVAAAGAAAGRRRQVTGSNVASWWQRLTPGLGLRGLAAAMALVVVAFGVYLLALRPQAVSAAAVLERAQTVARSPLAGGVGTFVLSGVEQWWQATAGGRLETRTNSQRWYGGPELWRVETEQRAIDSQGQTRTEAATIEVSDGSDFWQYDALRNQVRVQHTSPQLGGQGSVSAFGQGLVDLEGLLSEASRCYEPRLAGRETVAGRAAYKIDLGANKCPAAALPEFAGRQFIWVDQATSFILKWELYDRAGTAPVATSQVTAVDYNVDIDPARFRFPVPQGALLSDARPKALATLPPAQGPAPATPAANGAAPESAATGAPAAATPDQVESALRAALAPLAAQAGYAVFVPTYTPAGLQPRQPRLEFVQVDSTGGQGAPETLTVVRLEYVPAGQAEQDTDAMGPGIVIQQQRAIPSLVADWTRDLTPTSIGGQPAWYRRGERNPDGTGTNSVVDVLRDGTLITLGSFQVPLDELLRVAESMSK